MAHLFYEFRGIHKEQLALGQLIESIDSQNCVAADIGMPMLQAC